MTSDLFISDGQRIKLPAIFRQLGLKQHEVARALNVSPASISRFTSTGPDRINLRAEKQRKLVDVLKEQLAKCRTLKSLGYDELEERRKTDRNSVEAALAMTKEVIKTLENDIEELLVGDPVSDH